MMRKAGILLPIFSLPSLEATGTFGDGAFNFIDFLSKSGCLYWQILPLNPTDEYNSPYASWAMLGRNIDYIDTYVLCKEELLSFPYIGKDREEKRKYLRENLKIEKIVASTAFKDWKEKNIQRLDSIGLFYLASHVYETKNFRTWPDSILYQEKRALQKLIKNYEDLYNFYLVIDYLHTKQWNKVKVYAHQNHIQIIGDMPYYPGYNSCDIWDNRKSFQIDDNFKEIFVSGVPGDSFSNEGQIWSTPVYNWTYEEKRCFPYFKNRCNYLLKQYDLLRLDHFRGYEAFYKIPKGREAKEGQWEKGPGLKLFKDIDISSLIAEDLGHLSKDFYEFYSHLPIPGMNVLQFITPYNNQFENRIFYTSTHDTLPLPDWIDVMNKNGWGQWNDVLSFEDIQSELIKYSLNRKEKLVIFQFQDFLREKNLIINQPGTLKGNWTLQFEKEYFSDGLAMKIKDYLRRTDRLNE